MDTEGGKPKALTPEKYRGLGPITVDGKSFLVRGPDERAYLYSVGGGEPTPVPGIEDGDFPLQWTADGRGLYVQRSGGPGARIERLDLATGRSEPWKEILPADSAGVVRVSSVLVSPDGTFYAYAYSRVLSNLFLVEGSEMTLSAGTRLGPYEITRSTGRGRNGRGLSRQGYPPRP